MQLDSVKASSSLRRKPKTTYKSPTAEEWTKFTPCPSFRPKAPPQKSEPQNSPPPQNISKAPNPTKHHPLPYAPSLLPLYHPKGQLALSLPPLDPASFGLHLPPLNYNEAEPSSSRGSSRARRRSPQDPAPPPPPADSPLPAASTVGAVAAVAAHEIKEKASPRKRRTGGGKRKRKDAESFDTSYPAKRARAPRGITASAVVEEDPPEEDPMVLEDVDRNEDEDEIPVERRTTRSRAGTQIQDATGSGSEGGSSKSISPGAPEVPVTDSNGNHDVEMKKATPEPEEVDKRTTTEQDTSLQQVPCKTQEEKEEGELSDDGGGA